MNVEGVFGGIPVEFRRPGHGVRGGKVHGFHGSATPGADNHHTCFGPIQLEGGLIYGDFLVIHRHLNVREDQLFDGKSLAFGISVACIPNLRIPSG